MSSPSCPLSAAQMSGRLLKTARDRLSSKTFCLRCLFQDDLSHMPCPPSQMSCHCCFATNVFRPNFPFSSPCPGYLIPAVLSSLCRPGCVISDCPLWLSCPGCPAPAALSLRSCSGYLITYFLSWLYYPHCPFVWLFCPCCPAPALLSPLSYLCCRLLAVLYSLSCSG